MRRAAAIAIVALAGTAARAEDTHQRAELIVNDAVADALMAPSIGRDAAGETADHAMALGLLLHLLGGPTIHAAHGEWGTAGLDLGARAVFPTVGFVAGDLACEHWELDSPGHDYNHCFWLATTGFALGAVGAQVLDWIVTSQPDAPHGVTLTFSASF